MENGNNGIECDYFFFHGKENNWKEWKTIGKGVW